MSAVMPSPSDASGSSSAMKTPRQSTEQTRAAKFARRKLANHMALFLSLAAMAFGLFWLAWILWETLRLGLAGISLAVFTEMTPRLMMRAAWPMPCTGHF